MAFREILRDEMAYQGLSTRELAEKSGVGKRTLDNYLMSDPQEPSVTNAHKIALALGVSIEYLLTGEEYKTSVPITGDVLKLVQEFSDLESEQQVLFLKMMESLAAANKKARKPGN